MGSRMPAAPRKAWRSKTSSYFAVKLPGIASMALTSTGPLWHGRPALLYRVGGRGQRGILGNSAVSGNKTASFSV